MIRQIGRFDIRGELGRGAQSTVYLGYDPQLQREVAIKTLHFERPDPAQNQQLLAEARAVGKLRHANVVPIFEAGEEGGDVYLVFEYVPGRSLGEFLRQSGALTAVKAATLLRPVLDAVAQAHARGIIHRDLKPSNILLDENGTPRVMDFGIATRIDAPRDGLDECSGTPAYMAPEYVLRREVSERTDLFAAGLILFEMLAGRRAIDGDDLAGMFRRIVGEDLKLPQHVAVDERLGGILYKALARDPALRYQSAEQFVDALDAYLAPEEETHGTPLSRQSTIDFLLRRMRHKSDFPALSESVGAINKIANSESESVHKLSNLILKDFALTNKLLRLVNSAYFRPAGGGSISTVSRAVIVLGFETVRNIAITVLLFEHLQNKANAEQLKEAFLHANLAGILAKDLCAAAQLRDLEQAFICALFQNLGRLLAQYYFPEESDEIRRLMEQKACSEDHAAQRVLGISFESLGVAIARQWGFPPLIVGSMRKLGEGAVHAPATQEERLRVFSSFANELCLAVGMQPEERDRAIRKVVQRFAAASALAENDVVQTVRRSIEEVSDFARIIKLNLQQTVFGRQMIRYAEGGDEPGTATEDSLSGTLLREELLPDVLGRPLGDGGVKIDAQAVLTAGIQEISNTLVEGFRLNDILRIILETMYRAMGFRRVVLCIRDARSNTMQGRFGFGPQVQEVTAAFHFPLGFTPDIFHAATSRGVDVLISNIDDPKIAARIPAWYRQAVPAKAFVLFPLNIKGNPVALIYADHDEADDIDIPEKELSLLRTLRNQAVLAIKQGG
ncbi:serine/threonine protein kinase [Azonexus sp. R2A61]|uniref:serine/threonine protein kinase n=1 Tax=Azonexus sp. R2A61 TaxID=2744443 RepID=UPI001F271640|nr:serine/threonine protein kinase [Azonexus sp. R2A61]